MSYEVTATRRRPQQFENLVGQEFVAETLKNSIKSGKIAHAYLFTGPRGCGKTSSARILAKALNCANGPTDHPCGQCSNCQEITKGASLDVIEIDGASNTSVDNIRRIKDEILFPPTNCRYKIYIIDEVHMLTTSAFNALLKTIEEPPEYVIFIFATTELQKVPATIKSRCQQFNFRLVPIEKVKQCLAEACAEINVTADDEALFWIARESTGSMRDAYTLFDQVVAFSDGHITYDKIRDKLGLVGIDRLNTIFELAVDEKTDEVLNQLDGFLQAGVSIEQLISTCADYLRSLLLIKNGVTKEALLGNSPERYSKKVLSSWNTIQTERALSLYLQLYRDIRYSLSPRYEIELLFSRMCWIKNYVSASEVKKAIDAAQSLLGGVPSGGQGNGIVNQNGQPSGVPTFSSMQNVPQTQPTEGFGGGQNTSPSNNQPSGGVPIGMPTFSALQNVLSQSDSGGTDYPFSFGGELPPEQSASSASIPNASKNQISSQPMPNNFSNQSSYADYSVDDYSPSDDYGAPDDYPDDDYQSNDFTQSNGYGTSNQNYTPNQPVPVYNGYEGRSSSAPETPSVSAQVNDFFMLAGGRQISIGQLRSAIVAKLSVVDGFASIALQNTGLWQIDGNKICTTVPSQFELNTLQQKSQVINDAISAECGTSMYIDVKVAVAETKANTTQPIPPKVQMVIDMFRGSL